MSSLSQNSWPPDYAAEYRRRRALINLCENNPLLQAQLKRHYKNNFHAWLADWGITYDPRVKLSNKVIPFILFEKQKQFVDFVLECLRDKESGLGEKSRDVGATWLCCAISDWLYLFHPGSSIGWGSRDQDTVDQRGNPDSIFEKIRMQLNWLPQWMLPRGFDPRLHLKFMTITNPENGSSIKGDAGDNIGRGGRSLIYFKDESAHYEHPELIEAALGDNTDVQIDISSVHGTGNVFYRRRQAGELWVPGSKIEKGRTRVFLFDWRDHPGKTQEWYDNRKAKAEREGLMHVLAQEVDRDYAASIARAIIPMAWIKATIDAHKILGIKDDGEKISALDVADEGRDKNAFAARYGVVLKACTCWGQGDTTQTANTGYTMARELSCSELDYDCIGVGAGVKGETNRMIKEGIIPKSFKILPWNAAETPENPEWHLIRNDNESPLIGDFFKNRKSQGWWNLRLRAEKTYKMINKIAVYPHDELMSISSEIPLLHQICEELSQPVWTQDGKGKMLVDKKPDGMLSPNMGDVVMMVYHPVRNYGAGMGYLEFMGSYVQKQKEEREERSR